MLQTDFSIFPELHTPRLVLRKIIQEDAPEIFFLRSNEAVLRFLGKEPMQTLKEASDFIRNISNDMQAGQSIMWGIALNEHPSQLIGNICFWNIQRNNFRAEIGYVLHPLYWKKGYMKEAIRAVIAFGFSVMGLHSIEARIDAQNLASAASLEAAGFSQEGYLKEEFYFRGKFLDTIIYSRLANS
jgi:ribosomal-protein-alanine N-acetyltransferase